MATYSIDDFTYLLEVSDIDKRLSQLDFQRTHLPEAVALNDANSRARDLNVRKVELEAELSELKILVSKSEVDVEQVDSRLSKDQTLLDSGSISDSKQLTELQHEIDNLKKRKSELEDVELEILSSVEDIQMTLVSTQRELLEAEHELEVAKAALESALDDLNSEIIQLGNRRQEIIGSIAGELASLYEKIKNDRGVGAAALLGHRCESCHLELTGTDFSEIKKLPETELVRCPECKAILIRVLHG